MVPVRIRFVRELGVSLVRVDVYRVSIYFLLVSLTLVLLVVIENRGMVAFVYHRRLEGSVLTTVSPLGRDRYHHLLVL